jgi:hypothetical protein
VRRISYFKSLFLALLIGTVGLGLPAEVNCQKRSKSKNNVQPRLKFKAILYSDGENSSSHLYESFDGVRLRRTGEQYSSPALANERLENRLKDAVRVIKRNLVYKKRRRVGERVVAVFFDKETKEETVSIMGTYEEVFWSIDAPSLPHALAFESQCEK